MGVRDFFQSEARKRVGQAVEGVEAETTAEIVVSVRARAGDYKATDLYAGFIVALAMFLFMLFDPHEFDVVWMPVDVLVVFFVGAVASANLMPLRRALTSKRQLRENSALVARAAFYDLGVSRTTGRTGVLVFVSMFERQVEVVPDVGVKPDELGAPWAEAVAGLQASVADGPDFDRFLAALGSLKAPLTRALPAKAGHVNQLPNEPVIA
jgi:putative membrane protein